MSSYSSLILAEAGLVGYWTLDDTSGTSAAAAVGSAGTYVNTPTLSASPVIATGTAVTVASASSQDITLPHTSLGTAATSSVEFWFKWTGGQNLVRDNTGSSGWIMMYDNAGTINTRVAATTVVTSKLTTAVRDGAAHHYVLTVSPPNVVVYLDGASIYSGTPALTSASASPFHLGRNGTVVGQYVDATFDEFAIYNVALSGATVSAHYAAGPASTESSVLPIRVSMSRGVRQPTSGVYAHGR